MAAESSGDERAGIGTRLRSSRERLGMTLLQAAEKLHVDAKVLEALESERFDTLGAPVFVRGHLRRYAELVGERPSELHDLYSASTRVEAPDLTRLPKVAPSADPRKLVLPALVILIGFALAGAVWWVLRGLDASIATAIPEPTDSPVASSEAAPATPVVPEQTLPAPAPAPPVAQTTVPAAVAPKPEPTRARTTELTLRFSADSWVEVYDSKGERLFYDIGSANSVRTLAGTPPLRVVLGNAPGVAVEVNGRSRSIPSEAVENDAAQFTINASGRLVRQRSGGG